MGSTHVKMCDSVSDAVLTGNVGEMIRLGGATTYRRKATMDSACRLGKQNIIEFLYQKQDLVNGLIRTGLAGHWECFDWLAEHQDDEIESCGDVAIEAVRAGNIPMLERALFHKIPMSGAINEAAMRGKLEILQWAYPCVDKKDFPRDICITASKGGRYNVIEWARSNHFFWTYEVLVYLVRRDNLELVKRARAKGCPWNAHVCAAAGGNPKILEWLRGQNPPCPWDGDTYIRTIQRGTAADEEWLKTHGCPRFTVDRAYELAPGNNKMAAWIAKNFKDYWDEVSAFIQSCISYDNANHLSYLLDERFLRKEQILSYCQRDVDTLSWMLNRKVITENDLRNLKLLHACAR